MIEPTLTTLILGAALSVALPAAYTPKNESRLICLGDYALCLYDVLSTPFKPLQRLFQAINLAFSEWCGCFDEDWVEEVPERTPFDDYEPRECSLESMSAIGN